LINYVDTQNNTRAILRAPRVNFTTKTHNQQETNHQQITNMKPESPNILVYKLPSKSPVPDNKRPIDYAGMAKKGSANDIKMRTTTET
jgi:hypothetical protein